MIRTRHLTKADYEGVSATYLIRERKRIAIIVCILLAVLSLIFVFKISTLAHTTYTYDTYYTNTYINYGDTLSDIARRTYVPEYGSFDDYVDEIRTINHLKDDVIHYGEYLVIPMCRRI